MLWKRKRRERDREVRGTYSTSKDVGETSAESSLTQSDLACEIHVTQRVNSHLGFKHSSNIMQLCCLTVNWFDAVNRSRYYFC